MKSFGEVLVLCLDLFGDGDMICFGLLVMCFVEVFSVYISVELLLDNLLFVFVFVWWGGVIVNKFDLGDCFVCL